jgi:L-ascorbate metabolism protein UlaG (beta-lactamase superfamily)
MQLTFAVLLLCLIAAAALLAGCAQPPAPSAQTLASPHFRDGRFHNLDPAARNGKTFLDVLKWRMTSPRAAWPLSVDDNAVPDLRPRVDEGLRVTMINHASFLIQAGGLNILTDPVFSERASPFSFLGPKRARLPGIAFEDLPPIDIVLVSHAHYEHLDRPSLERLEKAFHPRFFVPLRNADLLPAGARVTEMDWGQSLALGDHAELVFTPAQHWAARGLFDRNMRFWGAFLLRFKSGGKTRQVYFAGDTGYGGHFRALAEAYGPVDVALLPIGAYEPRWFMRMHHMNPDDAVMAHSDLRAGTSIGMHFGTFQLTDEAIDAPAADLQAAMEKHGIAPARFHAPRNGETFVFD